MSAIQTQMIKRFGYNQPIFLDEIKTFFDKKDYSKKYIFKIVKSLVDNQKMQKYAQGVYYIPTQTSFGYSELDPIKVVEKKYIQNNGKVFGFYTGLALLNNYNLTTQVPNKLEIITNKETNIKREVKIGNTIVIVRKPKIKIDNKNVKYYELLELLSNSSLNTIKDNLNVYLNYIKNNNIEMNALLDLAAIYSLKVLRKIYLSEIKKNVIWK